MKPYRLTTDLSGVLGIYLNLSLGGITHAALVNMLRADPEISEAASSRPILLIGASGVACDAGFILAALIDKFVVIAKEEPRPNCPGATVWYSRDSRFPEGKRLNGCGFLVTKGPLQDYSEVIKAGQRQWTEDYTAA